MDEELEQFEEINEQPEIHEPRPAWQVWAARVGLVIVLVGIVLYLYQIANGGL